MFVALLLSESPEAPSPKERTMNLYQKIAFGAFGLLALALIIGATYDLNGLKVAVVFTLAVAFLTLKTTWKFIFSGVQLTGLLVGGVGHTVGIVGDELADWSKDRKAQLANSYQTSRVPAWDSAELVRTDQPVQNDLDVPSFMSDTFDRQN